MAFTFIRQQAEKYCAKRFSLAIFCCPRRRCSTRTFDGARLVYVQLDSAVYLFIVYGLCEPPLCKGGTRCQKSKKAANFDASQKVDLFSNSMVFMSGRGGGVKIRLVIWGADPKAPGYWFWSEIVMDIQF